ncbi:MAG: sirohydrochlorin chelatase [Streptosporangiaceae bacterium]
MTRAVPLVAVAHGSRDPRASATVDALLAEVRRQRPGLSASAAHLGHSAPSVGQALDRLAADGAERAVVLPLLLTAAYHSRIDIPGALSQARRRHPRLSVRYGTTLGPHPWFLTALERRLDGMGLRPGDPDTAVVLTAAGSSDARANATVAGLARAWRRRGWWSVVAAYASAPGPDTGPTPGDAVTSLLGAGAPRVAVAPYLLAPGLFAARTAEAGKAAGAAVAPVLGAAPEVVDVVLQRYDEALQATDAVAEAG